MEILEIFDMILSQHRSVEIAEIEFKRLISEEPDTRKAYKEWCHEQGYSERNGFVEYCNECLDEDEGRYDTLKDLDEI